jgi:hypothetical protein
MVSIKSASRGDCEQHGAKAFTLCHNDVQDSMVSNPFCSAIYATVAIFAIFSPQISDQISIYAAWPSFQYLLPKFLIILAHVLHSCGLLCHSIPQYGMVNALPLAKSCLAYFPSRFLIIPSTYAYPCISSFFYAIPTFLQYNYLYVYFLTWNKLSTFELAALRNFETKSKVVPDLIIVQNLNLNRYRSQQHVCNIL